MNSISQGDRRRLQLAQLRIAAEVADFCGSHGIRYVLLAGSALGARRHQGFIPWDDDMDIGMLREDYERFLQRARTGLSDQLYLQDWLQDPHMGAPFTKVRLNNSTMVEVSSKDTGGHKGIFVDVFPLDNVPGPVLQFLWRLQLAFWKRLLRHKVGYNISKKSTIIDFADLALRALSRFVPLRHAKLRLHSLMTKFRDRRGCRVVAIGGSYPFDKEAFDAKWTLDVTPLKFEDREFYCFSAIDEYLTHLYGNFMTFPPPEERYNKHVIVKLEFPHDFEGTLH